MPRIPDDQIEQLKRNISILHVCAAHGIELKNHGIADYVGQCPFHEEDEPSFIVTPSKNLYHCMGCDKGGSVIDLVMELDGLTFRDAVDKLMISTGLVHRANEPAPREGKPTQVPPAVPVERAAQLLERVVTLYERGFAEDTRGIEYLAARGIDDKEQLTAHRAGYCNGNLKEILPKAGQVLDDLNALGVLNKAGREHFAGCVVFPVLDVEGNIVTLYGRNAAQGIPSTNSGPGKRHVFLPKRHKGLWNAPVIKTYPEIIIVESILDALSIEAAGYPNVVALNGSGGLHDGDIEDLHAHGVQTVIFMLDGDKAGAVAADKIERRLKTHPALDRGATPIATVHKALPDDHDPNSFMLAFGRGKLAELIESDVLPETFAMRASPEPQADNLPDDGQQDMPRASSQTRDRQTHSERRNREAPTERSNDRASSSAGTANGGGSRSGGSPDDFTVACGPRAYRLMGLDKSSRKLKVTIRVEHAGRLHVDTLDLYSSRSRKILAGDLCRLYEETSETIEADIGKLIKRCESVQLKAEESQADAPVVMSSKDQTAAEVFGRRSDLIEVILSDFEKCGMVGEEPNKLLAYLAAISRKMDAPLSLLVLSSSGAGKTALQDTALQFVPPEDLVKLTSLSGKALFYKERLALKHKVLALEEGAGAEEATYAIRNLISAGELVIESTIKDLGTGRLTTMENRVEGPTSVFITTTNPETDPETKSRFFVTSIDEGRDQTKRILAFQRQRQTLDGLAGNMATDAILQRHRNFQRLLKRVAVVNPFADRLAYGDDRLQGRRDQPKYLNLIRAVAFLRQMQKQVEHTQRNGEAVPYVLVDVEDVRVANKLAHEILGRSLDELSRPGRSLLLLLDEMVEQTVERLKQERPDHVPLRTAVTFSRRQIREATGWAQTRVHRYLKELVDLEYVLIDSGRNGTLCRYRLAYEGQGKNGERFMLGLTDPDQLELHLS
jgi:DNA primase catalytic core